MLRNGNSNRGERTCGAVIGHDHTFVWSPQLLKQFILFHKIVKESFVALEDLQTEGICWESVGNLLGLVRHSVGSDPVPVKVFLCCQRWLLLREQSCVQDLKSYRQRLQTTKRTIFCLRRMPKNLERRPQSEERRK